jgi:2-desacetyl-2-hydroxyethyl bacteriochlorophyllide A dehydrogenase
MEAVVCRKPGELALETRSEPQRSSDEVLIGIRRIGICGTDFHIFEGSHPYLEYPRVLGHELSGEVVEAPKGSALQAGQIVVVNPYVSCGVCIACRNGKPNCCVRIAVLGVHRDGGMCERISVPERNVYPAGSLTFDEAASVEFLAIGAHAVARAGVGGGARTLVIGAGPIGLGAALFAGIAGGEVTVMDRDADRLAFAMKAGIAAKTIEVAESTRELVLEASDGEGFNVVFDATGARGSMEDAFGFVAHGGKLLLISVVNGHVTFSDPEFHKREMSLIGSRNALRSDFDRVMAAIGDGRVPLPRLLTHRTTLDCVATDLKRWTKQKQGLVKALIEIE